MFADIFPAIEFVAPIIPDDEAQRRPVDGLCQSKFLGSARSDRQGAHVDIADTAIEERYRNAFRFSGQEL